MRALASLPVLCALVGCSDYELTEKHDPETGGDDTALPGQDTGAVVDTGGDDTGIGTDTGDLDAPAREPIYLNEGGILWSWDPESSTLAEVGAFAGGNGPVEQMTDIAIDPEGQVYGCTHDALFAIHPETAAVRKLADLDVELNGLTFVSDGRLVGAGAGVWFIDTQTGARTTLIPEGVYETAGDIVGLPDGLLYWTVRGGYDEPDLLVVIDPDSGQTAVRGDVGTEKVYGLGYADGSLYGFSSGGEWVRIDHTFGGAQDAGPLGDGRAWWGATTNPVRWE